MRDLELQEQFELELLDKLNSKNLLRNLIFCGGTMLRLCYGLNRFSVDLDFRITGKTDQKKLFSDLKDCLSAAYTVVDSANKFYTLLFEIRSKKYPRSLKIEIRKESGRVAVEPAIAYSAYSNTQVFLNTFSLKEMMKVKIEAILERKEIRDAFDIEFLLKRGAPLSMPPKIKPEKLKGILERFNKQDYKVKLGSLLKPEERRYYTKENFKILKKQIVAKNA